MLLYDLPSRGKQCGSISNHRHVASARVDVATGWLLMVAQCTVKC